MLGIALFVLVGIGTLILLFGSFYSLGAGDIAVIDIEGEIGGSSLFESGISPSVMREIFEDVADDPTVVAVVLNINSGGGGVVETKEIAREISKLVDKKPVVAYIGDVGASGAYYLASSANEIVSDEDSIVGSIGVISTYPVYKDLLEEKLGINITVIKSGEFKDVGSPYREMTKVERERMQEIVDKIHDEFMAKVISDRKLTPAAIEEIETSSIFLGSEALELGLVDYNGGLSDAIDRAAELAELTDFEVNYIDTDLYVDNNLFYGLGRGVGDSLSSKVDLTGSLKLV